MLYNIPNHIASRLLTVFNKYHIIDMSATQGTPFIHFWVDKGNIYCESDEELSKETARFNEVIEYFERK